MESRKYSRCAGLLFIGLGTILRLIALPDKTIKFTFVGNPTLTLVTCLQDKHSKCKQRLTVVYSISHCAEEYGDYVVGLLEFPVKWIGSI